VDKTYAHISLRDIANLRSVALLLANGIEGTGTFTGVNAVQRSMSGPRALRIWAFGTGPPVLGGKAVVVVCDGRGKAELISAPHNLGNHGGLICCVHKGTDSPA
jgi:hypothetical protein